MNDIALKQNGGARGLSGNALKLMALVFMTVDHMGMLIFPQYGFMRIIGRFALPIFAYMIAEGCTYTHDRRRYLLNIFLLGVLYQIVYWFVEHGLYCSIFITFSLSITTIYSVDYAMKSKKTAAWILPLLALALDWVLCEELVKIPFLKGLDYRIDYGFFGVIMPVLVYIPKDKRAKLAALAAAIFLLYLDRRRNTLWMLVSVGLLAFYNGERGKLNIKALFYVYYPLHLVILELISKILK